MKREEISQKKMKKKSEKEIQSLLFQKIQAQLPSNLSLVDELADLLQVSNDSAYRRLRGSTILSIGEITAICNHFNISFDLLLGENSNAVLFNYGELHNEQDFHRHLLFILSEMELFTQTPDIELTYAAIDIPIFHHFDFKELTAFKIFYWLKSVINAESIANNKFSPHFLPSEVYDVCKKIITAYRSIKSTEIWTDATVNSLIKQISYFWESGMFESKEDALLICEQAENEILSIQTIAETSSKTPSDNNFNLYFSEIEIGNNSILASSEKYKRAYLSHNTINIIVTTHNSFCGETERWLNNLIKKSTLISGTSEKIRYQFFKRALDNIASLKNRINE